MKRTMIEVGDCFRIPLPNGRWAYCQFVHHNNELGFLVKVFDLITTEPMDSATDLRTAGLLFPPVFVGLRASVRSGRWKKIGNIVIDDFEFPKFRNTVGTKPGTYNDWWIWDGTSTIKIGTLPKEMRSLELEQVWGDEALEQRIVNGNYRGDYMF